jgi:formate hydrogenlyase transcriptional activator
MNKQIHSIPEETMEALKRHSWPGNIRELQNFIERAVILSPGQVLCAPLGDLRPDQNRFTDLRTPAAGGAVGARGNCAGAGTYAGTGTHDGARTYAGAGTLREAERAHILDVLRQVNWVVGGNRGAAVRLGLPRTTLLHRMKKLGIAPEEARQNSC